jgi:hypothetical protein
MSTTYLLRDIDPKLWAKVQAKAKSEGRTARGVILLLLAYYAKHGLPE